MEFRRVRHGAHAPFDPLEASAPARGATMYPSVHPSFIYRWKEARRAADCGVSLGCGPTEISGFAAEEAPGGLGGGAFGVRRPLRFLAYKLGLNEAQVAEMARILNDLKTERAQAAVDDRRAL